MAPTKQSSNASKGATRTSTGPARKRSAKKAAAKRSSVGAPRRAAAAGKKAAEPVARATNAVKRTTAKKVTKAGTTASSRQQPDAIRMLTDDHREVEKLFVRFEKTGEGAHQRRQDLVRRITEALSVHA